MYQISIIDPNTKGDKTKVITTSKYPTEQAAIKAAEVLWCTRAWNKATIQDKECSHRKAPKWKHHGYSVSAPTLVK